ncbi:hypothetical protein Tco_1283440 [Tanacetum coccineum]
MFLQRESLFDESPHCLSGLTCINSSHSITFSTVVVQRTDGESSVAGTAGVVTIVGVWNTNIHQLEEHWSITFRLSLLLQAFKSLNTCLLDPLMLTLSSSSLTTNSISLRAGDPLMLRLVFSLWPSGPVKVVGDGLKGEIFMVWWWYEVKRCDEVSYGDGGGAMWWCLLVDWFMLALCATFMVVEGGQQSVRQSDGWLTRAASGVGDEEVVVGEGVVVTSSSLEMLINSCLGGIMVSLIFLEGLGEEALVEFMVELFEEDEEGKKNEKDGLFNLEANDQSGKA